MIPDFAATFGGVGDGVTNNNGAFTAAEASAYERIWLPEGRFYTTLAGSTFTKRYEGPGKIYFGAGAGSLQGTAYFSGNAAVQDPQVEYGGSDNTQFSSVEYKIVRPGARKNFNRYLGPSNNLYSTYFWAPSTPHFTRFTNSGGWSGLSGYLTSAISVGGTTAVITGGVVGWQVGDTIGLSPGGSQDGVATDIVTVTAVNTGSNSVTFTPAVTHAYAAGDVVSHGYRTMNPYHLAIGTHKGGGDSYLWCGRAINEYAPLASQPHIFNGATIGIIGGDLTCTADGQFMTAMEYNHVDSGKDVGAVGLVLNFQRSNAGGARGAFWSGVQVKSEGSQPINNGVALIGNYTIGLDLVVATDFGTRKAAIALKQGDRIYFNNTGTPRAGYTLTGDTFAATPMYVGTGTDAAGQYWQAVNGTSAVTVRTGTVQINVPTEIAAVQINGSGTVGGNLSVTGTLSVGSFSPTSISTSGNITSTGGTVTGKFLTTKQNAGAGSHLIYFGDQSNGASYLIVDTSAGQAALYVKGVQKQLWS